MEARISHTFCRTLSPWGRWDPFAYAFCPSPSLVSLAQDLLSKLSGPGLQVQALWPSPSGRGTFAQALVPRPPRSSRLAQASWSWGTDKYPLHSTRPCPFGASALLTIFKCFKKIDMARLPLSLDDWFFILPYQSLPSPINCHRHCHNRYASNRELFAAKIFSFPLLL